MISRNRFPELDGIRGLAALTVVISHYVHLIYNSPTPALQQVEHLVRQLVKTPLSILWQGENAVIVFFVLSGFVLTLMLSDRPMAYGTYIVRRITRLYPPYLVAVVLAALGAALLPSGPLLALGPWINQFWHAPLTARLALEHLSFVGAFDTNPLDFVIWSLVQEMRLSLIFPLVLLIVRTSRWKVVLGVSVALSAAASVATTWLFQLPWNPHASWIMVAHYQLPFVIGSLLALNRTHLIEWYHAGQGRPTFIWIVGFGAYIYGAVAMQISLQLVGVSTNFIQLQWPVMIGSALLLLGAMSSSSAQGFLTHPVVSFLGRISYSLYLLHAVVLLAVLHAFQYVLPFSVTAALGFVATFPVATMAYRWIELPSQRLGRTLTERARPRSVQVHGAMEEPR